MVAVSYTHLDVYKRQIISDIHRIYPDCAIMLSLGEQIRSEYEQMYFAGANHYSLYHMTADTENYELSLIHIPGARQYITV